MYERVLKNRYKIATGMFEQAGFAPVQTSQRGHLMVCYQMGEATAGISKINWMGLQAV